MSGHRLSSRPHSRPCWNSRLSWTAAAVFILVSAACTTPPAPVELTLLDANALEPRPLDSLETGDSLSVSLSSLAPGQGVEIHLTDDLGQEWSYSRLFADERGNLGPTLLWYQSGVIGTTSRQIDFRPNPAFETFEEAERFFAEHSLRIAVSDLESGRELAATEFRVTPRAQPFLYPSTPDGVLLNSMDAMRDDMFVTGRNFPAGATVHLMAVDNQYVWNLGGELADRTGPDRSAAIETIELGPAETSFTTKIWDRAHARPGAYDLVARLGKDAELEDPVLEATDILSFNDDTAVLYYILINGNIVIESAGRMRSGPAKFEFSDSFEKGEDVYAAVDPTDVPAIHSGGSYAAYWVVDHQPQSYWDGASPALVDVSGGTEIQRVKYWCINASRRLVWANATQTAPIEDYDVIVDFGSTPAMDSASFTHDNTYTKGTDFIDGYDTVGFWLFEDPGSTGPEAVGQVEHDDPNGISGITDSTGVTGPPESVTLAWARIMYPATSAGTGTAVSTTETSYPVALFLHGRHVNCDSNGSANGGTGTYTSSCATANRIPSHEGYNYIMERLASHGIVSISISAHDIQPGLGAWDYDARGRLILKWLDKLRDWSDNGTDPYGGIFSGKLDMSRVALSGHSRGGEGVVAAQQLNLTWPTPHSILAVNAIAPTDQNNAFPYLMTAAPYYLLMAARDGDVSSMQGYRTYDRAYPHGAPTRHEKSVGWVYRANHNYFNTIWTDTAALGTNNPWARSEDDASWLNPKMSAADQRQVALTTIAAFFRQHLQSIEPYREIFTGRLEPSAMPNDYVFWTFQSDQRTRVDDFEQLPLNAAQNSVSGTVTGAGFGTLEERLLNARSLWVSMGALHGDTIYTDPALLPAQWNRLFHDTLGLRLVWASPQTYVSNIPGGMDVTAYTHFAFRVSKVFTGPQAPGPDINLHVNIEDGLGASAMWDLRTDQFDRIPHPFEGSAYTNQALMTGVRIPLRNFTMNNSGVDLTDIVKITIRTEGSGEIAVDEIEFGE